MEVIQFVMQFKAKVQGKEITDKDKIDIVSKMLNVKSYISIRGKQQLVKDIIYATVSYDNTTDKFVYNSFEKDLITIITLIKNYTELNNFNEEGYDLLCKNNLLDYVIGAFGKEYGIFLGVMNTYMQDLESKRICLEDL